MWKDQYAHFVIKLIIRTEEERALALRVLEGLVLSFFPVCVEQ